MWSPLKFYFLKTSSPLLLGNFILFLLKPLKIHSIISVLIGRFKLDYYLSSFLENSKRTSKARLQLRCLLISQWRLSCLVKTRQLNKLSLICKCLCYRNRFTRPNHLGLFIDLKGLNQRITHNQHMCLFTNSNLYVTRTWRTADTASASPCLHKTSQLMRAMILLMCSTFFMPFYLRWYV